MKIPVICNNCGIKWVRITQHPMAGGLDDIEYTDDLQYNCPKCGSNDYKQQEATNDTV
ncbi:MAG: hypothetical protein PHI12_08770 [Dehalococcoidales bacterium]|nr:hypothetical protein [Dehalococcoidales bacterium]